MGGRASVGGWEREVMAGWERRSEGQVEERKRQGMLFWPSHFQEPFTPHRIMSRNYNFIKVCSLKTVGPV